MTSKIRNPGNFAQLILFLAMIIIGCLAFDAKRQQDYKDFVKIKQKEHIDNPKKGDIDWKNEDNKLKKSWLESLYNR